MNIQRILENKFYILYKRILEKNEIMNKYVIYSSEEYNHDYFQDFNNLRQAKSVFNKITKEAIEYEKELYCL